MIPAMNHLCVGIRIIVITVAFVIEIEKIIVIITTTTIIMMMMMIIKMIIIRVVIIMIKIIVK